ncbi:Uncharacterised protein [Vibrio cholerae]|nr:Uncharacterised protein [Vibrio cholerae]
MVERSPSREGDKQIASTKRRRVKLVVDMLDRQHQTFVAAGTPSSKTEPTYDRVLWCNCANQGGDTNPQHSDTFIDTHDTRCK